jgi:hypothetical protein
MPNDKHAYWVGVLRAMMINLSIGPTLGITITDQKLFRNYIESELVDAEKMAEDLVKEYAAFEKSKLNKTNH